MPGFLWVEDKKETLGNNLYVNTMHNIMLLYFQMDSLHKLFQESFTL